MRNIIFLLLLSAAMPSMANVVEDCLPNSSAEASHACDTFIEGFIAGALLTDAAIVETFEKNEEAPGFVSRAYRTRLGEKEKPATFFASFCLPDNTVAEIIEEVRVAMVDLNPSKALGEVVYQLLKTNYPCD